MKSINRLIKHMNVNMSLLLYIYPKHKTQLLVKYDNTIHYFMHYKN